MSDQTNGSRNIIVDIPCLPNGEDLQWRLSVSGFTDLVF